MFIVSVDDELKVETFNVLSSDGSITLKSRSSTGSNSYKFDNVIVIDPTFIYRGAFLITVNTYDQDVMMWISLVRTLKFYNKLETEKESSTGYKDLTVHYHIRWRNKEDINDAIDNFKAIRDGDNIVTAFVQSKLFRDFCINEVQSYFKKSYKAK